MKTLCEFANYWNIVSVLIKERVKCRGKYVRRLKRCDGKKGPSGVRPENADDVSLSGLGKLDLLTAMMPGRNRWIKLPKKDKEKYIMADGRINRLRMYSKVVRLIIKRDGKKKETDPDNARYAYLDVLQKFVDDIQSELSGDGPLEFNRPLLKTLFKKETKTADGKTEVVYRPLSIYENLRDKVILALVSSYIATSFNKCLHPNILSYRAARKMDDDKFRVTDFNDGIRLIKGYREVNRGRNIFVADCDIKKFYDSINHDVVRSCFRRMMEGAGLCESGIEQVMRVLDAYLRSYNFYENVKQVSAAKKFWNGVKRRTGRKEGEEFRIDWIAEREFAECYGSREAFLSARSRIGVPQGGSLSLMIADVVLNDVDRAIVNPAPYPGEDSQKLFIRYCDDMILMHTDEEKCRELITAYCDSLKDHRLIYHDFTEVKDKKTGEQLRPDFWDVKSHSVFRWGPGEGNASKWIGFLGYEMRYDGNIRLRRSNVEKMCRKMEKQYFSSARMMSRPSTDVKTLEERIKKSMQTLQNSLNFYTELTNNPNSSDQLKRLNQRRKYFVKRAGCKALSAKCADDDADRKDLRENILKYKDDSYNFRSPDSPGKGESNGCAS